VKLHYCSIVLRILKKKIAFSLTWVTNLKSSGEQIDGGREYLYLYAWRNQILNYS